MRPIALYKCFVSLVFVKQKKLFLKYSFKYIFIFLVNFEIKSFELFIFLGSIEFCSLKIFQ